MKTNVPFALLIAVAVCFCADATGAAAYGTMDAGILSYLEILPAEDFESEGEPGGPFTPSYKDYQLTNTGPNTLWWGAVKTADWLALDSEAGPLDPGASTIVTVFLTSEVNSLEEGVYTDTLTFLDLTNDEEQTRGIILTVETHDFFTESFDAGDNDLDYLSLTLLPAGLGKYYEACQTEVHGFPTDPNGGTYVSLGDDDFAEVILSDDANVLFYGDRYDRFYIGSNGYITFGDGDVEYSASLENHFDMPRISTLFADLTPADTESISFKQLDDRVAVTYEDVPLYGDKDVKNSFQVEIFFADGSICLTWLDIAATGGIAGLSEGYGLVPFFIESDLTWYLPCWPRGDFDRNYLVDWPDLAIFVSHWLKVDCSIPDWCGRSDLDFSGTVNATDWGIFADNWLIVEEWWLQPVSHWKFDEDGGDTAYDSAGDNDGTIFGAEWTTGIIHSALEFDGDGDYVQASDGDELKLNLTGAISAWIYPHDLYRHSIVNKRGGSGGGLRNENYWLTFGSSNQCTITIGDGSNYVFAEIAAENFSVNNWYHVVGTWNPSNIMIYLNGELKDIQTNTLSFLISNDSYPVRIGYDSFATWSFDGKIDDVRIHDWTLPAEEVWQLYQEGAGGLVSHWKFDEGEGDTAYDSAGDNDGNLVGEPNWISGQIDGALSFDGDDDYVDVDDDNIANFNNKQSVTYSAWIKPSAIIGGHNIVVSSYNGDIDLRINTTNFRFFIRTINGWNEAISSITPSADTWYHVVGTYNGSEARIYVNGNLEGSDSTNSGSIQIDALNWDNTRIGRFRGPGATNSFIGIIDDVRIYERALSVEEIWQLYQEGIGGLVSHWKFDEGAGTIAYDSAGNNDGTIYGAQWTDGKIDAALDFDGDGDYVQASDGDELKLNLTGAISAWIYPHDLYRHSIVNKRGGSEGGLRNENYWLTFGSSNQCTIIIGDGSNQVFAEIAAENFSVNNWYHVVGTWNPSNIMIYLNGELKDIQTNTLSFLISNDSYPVRIGYDSLVNWSFDGIIDDVRIYEQALSEEEVQELYQEGVG